MNDNRAGIGTNWGAPRPRSVMEAFPMGIQGEYQNLRKKNWREVRHSILMVIMGVATFLAGCLVGPAFFH